MKEGFHPQTSWIGINWRSDSAPELNRYYAFRKFFSLKSSVRHASIKISARAFYRLWINDRHVMDGPCRCYPEYQSYDHVDISAFLQKGDNAIAVLVHHPGRSLNTFVNRLRPGVIAEIEYELKNGQSGRISTDASWQARYAEWYRPDSAMVSLSYGFQEHVDGSLEPAGWRVFKDKGEGWNPAWPYGPANTYPVIKMQARNIDYLVEEKVPGNVVFKGFFIPQSGLDMPYHNLRIKFEKSRIESEKLSFVRQQGSRIVIQKKPPHPLIITYDLGQTMPFRIEISTSSENSKTLKKIELYYSERVNENGKPHCSPSFGHLDEGQADSFIPCGQNSHFKTFGIRGGRFVSIVIYASGKTSLNLSFLQIHYPIKDSGFSCSDALVNRIFRVSEKTLKTCMLDTYVDCCTREQTLWIFDACVSGEAGFYTFGDTSLLRRSLEIVGQSSMPDGNLRNMGPAEATFIFLTDQTMTWVSTLYDYYFLSGDKRFLKEMEEPLFRFLNYCKRYIGKDGFFIPPWGTWHWVDWALLDKRPHALSINALLLIAALKAGRIARIIGSKRLSEVSDGISNVLKSKLVSFYDDREKCFLEHREPELDVDLPHLNPDLLPKGWPAGFKERHPKISLHGNVLMLLAGLLSPKLMPERVKKHALSTVLRILQAPACDANLFGPGWSVKIFGVLFEYGLAEEAFDLLKRYYGDELKSGAPTWAEGFRGGGTYNTAHGWGACVNTLIMRYVLGAVPLEPGWKRFTVRPVVKSVDSAEGVIHSPCGEIHISWKRKEDGGVSINVKKPRGIKYVRSTSENSTV